MTQHYDVIVLGGGPGGYVAAIKAAQNGLKTVCIDSKPLLGGTCLNIGCIPSKTLLHSTELYHTIKSKGEEIGIKSQKTEFDLSKAMKNKEDTLSKLGKGISFLFKKNKVTYVKGTGRLLDTTTVEVSGETSTTIKGTYIILAMGSQPIELPFLPFNETTILSSTGALNLKKIPKHLAVIGAGVIGVELASVYQRIGSQVTVVEFLDKVCPFLDHDISTLFERSLTKQGLSFKLSTKVEEATHTTKKIELVLSKGDHRSTLEADAVLVAIGRKPNTTSAGLKELHIALDSKGFVSVNAQFQTTQPNIFAIGDLIDGPMLAHKASEEGVAVAEIISGNSPHIDYACIPNVIYTSPEVASVGFSEEEAKNAGFDVQASSFPFIANSRANCIGETEGVVKVIAEKKHHKLLGFHIMGPQASEMLTIGTVALQERLTVEQFLHTCFPHPNLSEAIKEATLGLFSKAIHF